MQTSVPELTDLSGEPDRHLRAVRPGRAQARHLRRELPARPPPGRARRALHPALSPRLGPARRTCRRDLPQVRRQTDQACRRAGHRTSSSAACSTTRWSSGAANSAAPSTRQGKLTKDNYGRDHHPRCFTDVDGRRRRQGRRSPTARPTTTATTSWRRSRPRPRPPRHDPAPAGHRPRTPHLQVPGPRLPPHRRAGQV